jgi:hypothetical protein
MKTFEEALNEVISIKTEELFHNLMNGGNGNISNENIVAVLSIVYEIPMEQINNKLQNKLIEKEKDLKNHWRDAVNGKYDFNTN